VKATLLLTYQPTSSWLKNKKKTAKIPSHQLKSCLSKNSPTWRNLLTFTMRETPINGAFRWKRKILSNRDASHKASKPSCSGLLVILRLICQRFETALSIWTLESAGNHNCMRWRRLISPRMDLYAKLSIFIGRLWVQRIASSSWRSKNGTTSLSRASGLYSWKMRWTNVSKNARAKWERHAT